MTTENVVPETSDNAQPFAVGDVVSFRSGGLVMTVLSVDESGVVCVWSQRDGNPFSVFGGGGPSVTQQRFPAACLSRAQR